MKILHRHTNAVIYEDDAPTMKETVEAAVKAGSDLRGSDLHGSDLHGSDLHGSNLRGSNLCFADLHGSNLRSSDLRSSDLHGSDLHGSNLYGSNLRGSNLCFADLHGSNLRSSDLHGSNLYGSNLCFADLHGSNLRSSDLRSSDLRGSNLCFADQKLTLIGERPLFSLGVIGSRNDYMYAYITDSGVYVRTGCFFGPLNEFIEAVEKTHGDGIHGKEYRAAIEMAKIHAELWTPTAAESPEGTEK